MRRLYSYMFFLLVFLFFIRPQAGAQDRNTVFNVAESSAKKEPWVFWYWMNAAVSRQGIKADLVAMKNAGIGGAYLMPISGPDDPPAIQPPVTQLSPRWWEMVDYAMKVADSLGLKLGMDVCDGFATAGGPWITPELSMQKVVWSKLNVKGDRAFNDTLPQPESYKNYYKDIAVYAYPSLEGAGTSTFTETPKVRTSNNAPASFLLERGNQEHFVSHKPCWIQYEFNKPFTCRSIKVRVKGPTVQAFRMIVTVSNDGKNFHPVGRLKPARSGWQDYAVPEATFSLPAVTAKYFRFMYDPAGSEPGSEDLDGAKWKPTFKLIGLSLFSQPQINQFEGKNGSVWRISKRTTSEQIPDSLCIPENEIINITSHLDSNGHLHWQIPKGDWTILRMGHTSTGQQNATGGAAKGLECDKFNPKAVKLQFDHWYGEVFEKAGKGLASKVLKDFHVDSWECGSQNWSPVFREAFEKYCGYDPLPYLPVMAGVPVESAETSERFLYDVRKTIAALITDNFFGTLRNLAHEKGVLFSAESVAPTMVSDNLSQFKEVDIPMGEFWLRSLTHDKPNDILDAISGGHIYGKNIISAESFTELRIEWDEHPGMLKTLLDRNFALGINQIVYHVFAENPWLDRKPGMTLNGVGLYFQRDQTWWKPGHAWVDYTQRCQKLLQEGHPVVDIAAYTGSGVPRRGLTPDRLLPVLPGLFGEKRLEQEKKRLDNKGEPLQHIPHDVTSSANIYNPANWINPLRGYHYDSFNEDALLRLGKVKEGKIEFPGGMKYRLLVFPGERRMQPEGNLMPVAVGERLLQWVKSGAVVLMKNQPVQVPGLDQSGKQDRKINRLGAKLLGGNFQKIETASGVFYEKKIGKGRIIKGPFTLSYLDALGIRKDFIVRNSRNEYAKNIAWTHRQSKDKDLYFVTNQLDSTRIVQLSLRVSGKIPELYNAVTDEEWKAKEWKIEKGRTVLSVKLPPNGSLFVILKQPTAKTEVSEGTNWPLTREVRSISGPWQVHFQSKYLDFDSSLVWKNLQDWSKNKNEKIRYYSGTTRYYNTFNWDTTRNNVSKVWLDLGNIANIANVKVNGRDCGVIWTFPYRTSISAALKQGKNKIEIAVTNTWANRLIGDHKLPEKEAVTQTNALYRIKGDRLLPAGLLGPVKILIQSK